MYVYNILFKKAEGRLHFFDNMFVLKGEPKLLKGSLLIDTENIDNS